MKPRRGFMRELSEKVKNILQDNQLYSIPVDVYKLAKNYGFTVLQQDLDCSGAILVDTEKEFKIDGNPYKRVILIDNYQSNARKNFTVAHELGHYFMDFNESTGKIYAHREDSTNTQPREQIANDFASELLMPYELINKFIKEISKTYQNYNIITRAISDAFNVSLPAASYRYDKFLKGI